MQSRLKVHISTKSSPREMIVDLQVVTSLKMGINSSGDKWSPSLNTLLLSVSHLSGIATGMASSLSRAIIATNSVLLALSGLSVILRIHIRKQKSVRFGSDDYLILVALVSICPIVFVSFC